MTAEQIKFIGIIDHMIFGVYIQEETSFGHIDWAKSTLQHRNVLLNYFLPSGLLHLLSLNQSLFIWPLFIFSDDTIGGQLEGATHKAIFHACVHLFIQHLIVCSEWRGLVVVAPDL